MQITNNTLGGGLDSFSLRQVNKHSNTFSNFPAKTHGYTVTTIDILLHTHSKKLFFYLLCCIFFGIQLPKGSTIPSVLTISRATVTGCLCPLRYI